ncbi:MAG: hypothetical protein H6887_00785 [Hoeflea sp.]|nr:hypothetical protein [Hoeflea sp.]
MTPRLTIITNHPRRAILAVLGVEAAPSWCRVITRIDEVRSLPSGAKVIGSWFEPRKFRSALEWAFIERRGLGDLVGLSAEDLDKLAEWAARNHAKTGLDSSLAAAVGGMVISERRVS